MADLKSQGQNVAETKLYADIDFRFRPHPITGDVTIKYDTDAIKRAVRNIVLTNFYERPFKPSLGSSLRNQLFEMTTDRKVRRLADRIQKIIEDFEPRVENVKVQFGEVSDRNELDVTIFYNIKNNSQGQELDFTVSRAR
jgi:phage baseplate assembly protein W